MNPTVVALMIVDVISMGLLFYLFPISLIKFLGVKATRAKGKASKFVVEQLPGFFFGGFTTACFVYFAGLSYEQMIVNTGRSVGIAVLSQFGLDPVTLCSARIIEEHFTTDEAFRQEAGTGAFLLNKSTFSERDSVVFRGFELALTNQGGLGLLERAARAHCEDSALNR